MSTPDPVAGWSRHGCRAGSVPTTGGRGDASWQGSDPADGCGGALASFSLGIALTGCAAMTQDVDAYYRQMAVNYQEAAEGQAR